MDSIESKSSEAVTTAVVASILSLIVVGGCLTVCIVFVGVVLRVRNRRRKFYRQTEVRKAKGSVLKNVLNM